jgi:hypothetical protein
MPVRRALKIEVMQSPRTEAEAIVGRQRGYLVVDPANGSAQTNIECAMFVPTLEEAADAICHGFSLWVIEQGHGAVLVPPERLRIVYAQQGGEQEALA